MKVLALSGAARKHTSDTKNRRGKYTKQAEREAAKSLPPAWKIGDRNPSRLPRREWCLPSAEMQP